MNYLQANERLQYLGWEDFVLDYHTMHLAIACFEVGDFNRSEKITTHKELLKIQ
jgi:hypothetical protein